MHWLFVLGQVIKVLEGHTRSVLAVAISTDGSKIVSGSADNTVRVWSMETGQVGAPVCFLIDCLLYLCLYHPFITHSRPL